MIEYIKELITRLGDISSVSGFEDTDESKILGLVSPYFDSCRKTRTGSYVFTKSSARESSPKILIDAHIDEVGLIVTKVCDGGFLKFSAVGGVDSRILSGADVTVFGRESVRGVVTSRAPHLMSAEEAKKNPDTDKLYIDTGLEKDYLEENAGIGSPAGFTYPVRELLNNRVAAKGLDNKASVAVALTVMKLLEEESTDACITLSLSTREELGGAVGAASAAFEIMPDAAIVLDVNFGFLPQDPGADVETYRKTAELGEGAVVSISASTDRRLTRKLIEIADDEKIPCQTIVEGTRTGTNADRIALTGGGIPTALIGVPLQNMHTYSEVVCTDDILSTAKIIAAYIKRRAGESA